MFEKFQTKATAFPSITSFTDLFSKWELPGASADIPPSVEGTSFTILTHCAVYGPIPCTRLRVLPTQQVVDWIQANMLPIEWGVYFLIHVYQDGSALVTVVYEQIIGSRWLAVIRADTIPDVDWEEKMKDADKTVRQLIADGAQAAEQINEDDLEKHAEKLRKGGAQ